MISHNHAPRSRPEPGRTPRTAGRAAGLALLVLLAGCADQPLNPESGRARPPDAPPLQLNPACAGSGGLTHAASTITATERWYPADNPHRVTGTITVSTGGQLRIQAGALVCFDMGTGVQAVNGGTFAVDGRDTAIAVLTAADLATGWSGIVLSDTPSVASFILNARVEHVPGTAVWAEDRHLLVMDSVHIRQTGAAARLLSPHSRILRSRVDTTSAGWAAAVTLGDSTRFTQTTIRGAFSYGLVVLAGSGVLLAGGRIEGSGGVGLWAWGGVAAGQPIRVVGGAAHPAEISIDVLAMMYPSAAAQDSLLGNARDTVYVLGGTLHGGVYAEAALPWRVKSHITVSSGGTLRAQPGAHLAFDFQYGLWTQSGGRVMVRGAAGNPVVLTAADTAGPWLGVRLDGAPASASYLTNVVIEHVIPFWTAVEALPDHRVVIDSAVIRQVGTAVTLWSDGSRLSRSRVDTTHAAGTAAVMLSSNTVVESTLIRGSAGPGLEIWGPADVRSCEIRESADEGIDMTGWPVDVHNCNLVGNGGVGILTLAGYTPVPDATNNWWGDAAGPTGPNGDGVSGTVTVSPWQTTPYVLPYVP
jgi:hypothetical protein